MPHSTPPPDDAESPAEPAGNEPDAVEDGTPNEAPENRPGETYSDILRTEIQALAASLNPPGAPEE